MDTLDSSEQQVSPENDNIRSTTSPTAYSFTGGALDSDTFYQPHDKSGRADAHNENLNKASGDSSKQKDDEKQDDSMYECNICLDTAKDAVVSLCGHLFCWPCLHQWLETKPHRKLCPVCKAVIGRDKVIPLYGRNSSSQMDPRDKVPPRPAGQRTEPEPNQSFMGFNFADGFQMSFGIGAFPFGYFSSSFNLGEQRPPPPNRGTAQYEYDQQVSKVFVYLGLFYLAWLLFA